MAENSLIEKIIIIGAGQAAIQLAHSLRAKKFDGAIRIIGEENYPAYQRPPLSKAFLKGDLPEERLFLKPPSYYENKAITLLKGVKVEKIDRQQKKVHCSNGETYPFDKLIIATGSRPRTIPELDGLENVAVMRDIEDAKSLKSRLSDIKKLALIGGGYIGLEAAAVIRQLGIEVTVVERMPKLLARVTGDEVAEYFLKLHQENGVDIKLNAEVSEFVTNNKHITAIQLSNGESIPTDMVLLGIGVLPNQELAIDAELERDNGIVVDEDALTSDPNIYAIGDCSMRPLSGQKTKLRLESVPNAIDQAEIVTSHIVGLNRPAFDPPWFWSDQYKTKIQTVGLFSRYTDTVIRGDVDNGKFAVFYFEGEQFIAVDAINDPQSFMASKQILKLGLPLTKAVVANEGVSMMDILKSLKNA
jgi:3-phenylpropionate/trans-cinnamate dioxygenase ferredoxin reductase subunit